MWGSVAVLALPIAFDPVRLGVNLLLISRPRPAQNLLVYWVGCVTASVMLLMLPLLALHFTDLAWVHDLANPRTTASATMRHLQVAVGVLLLVIAAVTAVRMVTRRRTPGDDVSPISKLLHRDPDAPPRGGLLGRAQRAWEGGALWVAAVIGFWAGPNPSLVLFALTTILASGAAIGTQIGVALVFIVVSLAVVEVVLLCNVVAPAKTQAALRKVHDWVGGYRQQIVVAIVTLVGLAFIAQGAGLLA
ncbi:MULTISPECIES: GAP family protein [unclassified Mycobacterium]|uniref:GAP family protein n=1 Tax=unclassified Mycobacterium TaxID=2642494 RepID=UPI00048EE400|nr:MULTISPECIES: GAP family protein [unclassified Mycobacterium]SEA77296.1 Sap, sulfolipid-1-addressing protein [Mycobacterium sp. 283mftsu]